MVTDNLAYNKARNMKLEGFWTIMESLRTITVKLLEPCGIPWEDIIKEWEIMTNHLEDKIRVKDFHPPVDKDEDT